MLFEKTSLIDVFILIGFALVFWDFAPTENVLYQEIFKSDCYTGSDVFTCTTDRLSLDTGSPENKGSVKWNGTIAVQSVKIFCQWW
jgi:hypothetical protein